MFDHDRSDAETAELVKEWLARHLPVIFAGIAIALLIIFGMKWWDKRTLEANYRLSYQIDTLEKAVAAKNDAAVNAAYTADLKADKSNYGALAALLFAQHQQQQGKTQEAIAALEKAGTASDTLIAQTAQWQLAYVKIGAKDFDGAMQALNSLEHSVYQSQLPLLRGDIDYLRGNSEAALKHYQQSQTQQASPLLTTRIRQLETQIALQSAQETQ